LGLERKLVQAIISLYKDVKCCVRVNGFDSHWFDTKCGLKQDCPLSPMLFNLYITDLAYLMKSLDKGIKVDNDKISILLYANDDVLLAENAYDLKYTSDHLSDWCSNNLMIVNCEKSNIIHFRINSMQRSDHVFRTNSNVLEYVHSYKYLGIVLNEF
jgi:hypothetical protein